MSGLILAAPTSGAGKTTITLGLLRALKNAGHVVRSAKSGPDYIDPQFHAAATGRPCVNLDAWAMSVARIKSLASGHGDLIIEGAMGLFDGAPPNGKGSTADLARILGLPVVLIVDAKAMSQSVAALVSGFARFDPTVRVAGVILNRVGSDRHTEMLKTALAPLNIPVLGAIPRRDDLSRPSRHLGLIQAGEMPDLEAFLDRAAACVASNLDLTALRAVMAPSNWASNADNAQKTCRIATYAGRFGAKGRDGTAVFTPRRRSRSRCRLRVFARRLSRTVRPPVGWCRNLHAKPKECRANI
jgi:cobyrinic acid a,c-diamide synthase